jgi:hypothetical protein
VYYRIPFLENIFLPRLERASERESKRRCFPEWCCLCSVAVIELDALALMWIMALISSPYTLSSAVGERCGRRGVTFAAHNFMEKIIIVEQFLLDEGIYGQARKSFVILLIPRNCE